MQQNLFSKLFAALRNNEVEDYGMNFLLIPDVTSREEGLALGHLLNFAIEYGEFTDRVHVLSSKVSSNGKLHHNMLSVELLTKPWESYIYCGYDAETQTAEVLYHVKEVKALVVIMQELFEKIVSGFKPVMEQGELMGYVLNTSVIYPDHGNNWRSKVQNYASKMNSATASFMAARLASPDEAAHMLKIKIPAILLRIIADLRGEYNADLPEIKEMQFELAPHSEEGIPPFEFNDEIDSSKVSLLPHEYDVLRAEWNKSLCRAF